MFSLLCLLGVPVVAGVIFNTATAQRFFFNMATERAVAVLKFSMARKSAL
jgi:hypothetical protein